MKIHKVIYAHDLLVEALQDPQTVSEAKDDMLAAVQLIAIDMRSNLCVNMDIKIDFYEQNQTYLLMQVCSQN